MLACANIFCFISKIQFNLSGKKLIDFFAKDYHQYKSATQRMMNRVPKAGHKKIINSLILRGKKILQSTWYDFSDLIIELFSSLLNHISWKKNITNQRSIGRKAPEYLMHRW